MFELGLYIVGAFLLYILLFPLLGMAIGGLIYCGTPYLAGIALASITHKIFHGSFFDLGAFWVVAFLWAALLVHIRQICKKALELDLSWHEGHYIAATNILLMGRPYRKARRVLAAS